MPPTSEQDEHPAGDTETASAAPDPPLRLALSAQWVSPSIARDAVRRWLRAHRWSPEGIDELVLAISEAVTNSIEHGYGVLPDRAGEPAGHPGIVELAGRVVPAADGRRAEFTISDQGRWLNPAGVPGGRGHGLTIIRACAEEVRVSGGASGTTVFLRSRPGPRRW
ncbi:MAG TPA: ATP-binding protein [Amycolatopsis sp.]|nr:ATP-binding protein [Amycolatopsis sp.]